MDWREKLFGKVLVNCVSAEEGSFETVPTLQALAECREEGEDGVCGIYFSFANISDESDDFGLRLEQVYRAVQPRLKVVQVVLWAHVGTPEGPVEREAGFRRTLTGKPWFAVPFHDVDTKRRLTKKYNIAVGVPTLVVRGRHVRDALLADPEGAAFPWPAPPLAEVLRGVPLEAPDGTTTTYDELPADSIRLFYFAAHWCPPCRTFAPSLCATLSEVRKRRAKHANCQLILVSSDRSEQSYARTRAALAAAGALALPWGAAAARAAADALGVAGIPALLTLDARGALLARDARARLHADPRGLNFPWGAGAVSVLTEAALLRLARHPALVLFVDDADAELEFAEAVLAPAADAYLARAAPAAAPAAPASSSDDELDFEYAPRRAPAVQFLCAAAGSDAAELLRDHLALDDALPLLVAVDFPRRRVAPLELGAAITTLSVQAFLDAFLSGAAPFQPLRPYTDQC